MKWSNDYVGIPFLKHGYTRDGCSCWGLVRLVMMEQFDTFLPRHDQVINNTFEGKGLASADQQFASCPSTPVPFGEERAGDVLQMWSIMYNQRVPLHIGVIVEKGKVLHIEDAVGAIVEDYVKSPRVQWRAKEVFRVV
jgi:lipoprotein Spr